MASPQIENGFTRIANEILEHVYSRKFAANQLNVIMVVWRYTYGFQRKDHDFSLNFLSDATGIERKSVKRSLDALVDSKVITVVKEAGFTSARVLEFNKNYDEWSIEQRGGQSDHTTGGQSDHTTGGQSDHTTGGQSDHQERKVLNKGLKESSSSGQNEFAEIMKFYSDNLQRGLSETPFNLELLGQFFDETGFDLLMAAMKVAAKAEAKGINFVEGVLRNWKEAGVKDLDDARNYQRDFQSRGKGKSNAPKPKAEEFDLSD